MNTEKVISCKLTTPELRIRKNRVIAALKLKVKEKQEMPDGYKYRFAGAQSTLDEVVEFIKTERACCDFFIFNLIVSGDKNDIWLQLAGPEGVKKFIRDELEF